MEREKHKIHQTIIDRVYLIYIIDLLTSIADTHRETNKNRFPTFMHEK